MRNNKLLINNDGLHAMERKSASIPLASGYKFDVDALLEYITTKWNDKHKLIFIPNPNNPTGTYLSKSETSTPALVLCKCFMISSKGTK